MLAMFALIAVGLVDASGRGFAPTPVDGLDPIEGIIVLGDHLPLEVVDSPYRALVAPLACYIDALRTQRPDLTLTVVLPEIIVRHRWQQLLHNGTARRLRRALRRQPGVVTTTIPLHLAT